MLITATAAKNQFGQVLEACLQGPVEIEKSGRRHGVLLSAKQYDELMRQVGQAARGQGTGARFYAEYREWVDLQNAVVDAHGIPGEEYRPW